MTANTATGELRAEHEGILRMLAVLTNMAARWERGQAPDPGRAGQAIEFLQVFADRCHHGKEEDVLFPALEAAGMPRDGGPIGVMLHEHTLGRGHIGGMAAALSTLPASGAGGWEAFFAASGAYVELLTQHIAKENQVLFVMAERLLGEEALIAMLEPFERVETERIGPGRHEAFHALLDALEAEYPAH